MGHHQAKQYVYYESPGEGERERGRHISCLNK